MTCPRHGREDFVRRSEGCTAASLEPGAAWVPVGTELFEKDPLFGIVVALTPSRTGVEDLTLKEDRIETILEKPIISLGLISRRCVVVASKLLLVHFIALLPGPKQTARRGTLGDVVTVHGDLGCPPTHPEEGTVDTHQDGLSDPQTMRNGTLELVELDELISGTEDPAP